ncbi:MAG: peroxidase [Burkholderiales bacterium]|nr:peroxidase [Burkholderiales bacterium]
MAGHGSKPLRGLESTAQSSVQTAKFGRMFRWLEPAIAPQGPTEEQAVRTLLTGLAGLMVTSEFSENLENGDATPDAPITKAEPADENPTIPAGYTYLGQFVDHDITFDPTSSLQRLNDPDALEDFRTPRLDLDCLYGRGPADQPYLYQKPGRGKFILGPNRDKVFDQIAPRFGAGQQDEHFLEAQRIVRWCYQFIVLNDFLPRICDKQIVKQLMPAAGHRGPNLQFYTPHGGQAYIPVEFSVAAYRFGHSMVRPSYALNDVAVSSATFDFNGAPKAFGRIPIFVAHATQSTDAMNGFGELAPQLPPAWGIDWAFFFGKLGTAAPGAKQIPQPSYRIDASLVDPLGELPEFAAAGVPSPFASLAFRNLQRAVSMGLPSGQNVARMMGAKAVLSDEQLWSVKNEEEALLPWPEGTAFFQANKTWLEGTAPLWYYVLKEAEVMHHGHHLGEVGSRIVAETLIGLAWHDHYSYLFQSPRWTPAQEKLGLSATLDMLALTQFVG